LYGNGAVEIGGHACRTRCLKVYGAELRFTQFVVMVNIFLSQQRGDQQSEDTEIAGHGGEL
jgi:hypothetical protein